MNRFSSPVREEPYSYMIRSSRFMLYPLNVSFCNTNGIYVCRYRVCRFLLDSHPIDAGVNHAGSLALALAQLCPGRKYRLNFLVLSVNTACLHSCLQALRRKTVRCTSKNAGCIYYLSRCTIMVLSMTSRSQVWI
jgi:hypothetical protein